MLGVLENTWYYSKEAAPFLLFGFLVAGLIYEFVPREKIAKYLGGCGLAPVGTASVIGTALPLCSCGVIPTGIGLHRKGAGLGPTLAFFIATPALNPAAILVTYSLINPEFAAARLVATIFVAMLAGLVAYFYVSRTGARTPAPVSRSTPTPTRESTHLKAPPISRLESAVAYGFDSLMRDIGKLIIIGIIGAAILAVTLPSEVIQQYLGGYGLLPLVVMLLVGTPMYICATGSVPVVAALMGKGMSAGAGMVFLIAGPATNISTIFAMYKGISRAAVAIYLFAIVVGSLIVGLLVNMFY